MKNITVEYLEKTKKELNCVSVILIIADSEIPCPDTRSGDKCAHQHDIGSGMDGFSLAGACSVFSDVIANSAKDL